jgi:hypothetical protein
MGRYPILGSGRRRIRVFLTFWRGRANQYRGGMSENVRFYPQKMAAQRAGRRLNRPLRDQLTEILGVVADCERRWALEDRIERQIGR